MNFSAEDFSLTWLVAGFIIITVVLLWSLITAPWSKLISDSESQHVFVGVVLVLSAIWLAQVPIMPNVGFHLLLLTSVTLMFGPQFAIIAGAIALIITTFLKEGSWMAIGLNGSIMIFLPVLLVWLFTILSYKFLEKNFFVFILFNGFFVAAISTIIMLFISVAIMYYSGAYEFERLSFSFIPFIPLMIYPEAFINGLIIMSLVLMKPQWVSCFDDDMYLKGK